MGNWHCIPSSCAEVVYQPYDTAKVRWHYGNEPWQEIIGADNYTTETIYNTSLNTSYQLVYEQPIISNGILQGWTNNEFKSGIGTWNGIQSWRMRYVKSNGTVTYQNPYSPYLESNNVPIGQRSIQVYIEITSQGITTNRLISGSAFGFWGLRVQPTNANLQTTNCVFKVYRKGAIVHQETRSVCPTVEKIPCSLSTIKKSVKVKKIPYLQRVEVVPYHYSAYRLPGISPAPIPIVQADPIPAECWNIYYNDLYVIPPPGAYENPPTVSLHPNATPFATFVAQICSAPGCPRPEYEVICDCQCEKCPDYTCPIECGDFICCYNDHGTSVQTITKDKYCGGAS